MNRRNFVKNAGLTAFGAATINGNSLKAVEQGKIIHHAARAKNIIFMHMVGAPSQVDLFDHKPMLNKYAGKPLPESVTKEQKFAFISNTATAYPSPWKFKQHGESGAIVSELLPHFSKIVDDVAIVRSMHTDEFNHGAGELFMHTGFGRLGRPGFGAWVNYALGSENENLPSYAVLSSGSGTAAGNNLWRTGFLPSKFQGVKLRNGKDPVLYLKDPQGMTRQNRRKMVDALAKLNQLQYRQDQDEDIMTRTAQFQMAYRMQDSVPEAMDISRESEATLKMYGIKNNESGFAKNCLLARRMVERGVRFVQLFDGDWDHHGEIEKLLPKKCGQIDQPMSALIQDLKQRGLLDETLVIWGGEFGRTPMAQGVGGRDHHNSAFTMWLAGGGIKGGVNLGVTDDFGFAPVQDGVHIHDLHATALHLLGIDHERLTYRYLGRDFRLTDVHGKVVRKAII